uniref:CCHC-type domain-containing protein n=1 Tax=Amphimedon queenslandica TaxID=400682 RepID=A0A1X7VUA5_AMPQE
MKHQREQHKTPKEVECYRCGGRHYATHCRFKDVDCRSCGKEAHLAKVCRSSKKRSQQPVTLETIQIC